MRPDTDQDIDRLLLDAGDHWRSQVTIEPNVDVGWFRDEPRWRPRRLAAISGAAALGTAVIAALLLFRMMPAGGLAPGANGIGVGPSPTDVARDGSPFSGTNEPPAPTAAPPKATPIDDIVREGDAVVASGRLWESDDGPPLLCPRMVSAGGDPGCLDSTLVQITGVDARSLPGSEANGKWVTTYITVRGTWGGEGIQATEVIPDEAPPLFPSKLVPCDAPAGGWPGQGMPGTPDAEQAALDLQDEVATSPDVYVGIWTAIINNSTGVMVDRTLVVGTTGDVESALAELSEIYPFNLCITKVEYSARELDDVVDRLTASERTWMVEVDPSLDRVVVKTIVLDPATAEAVAEFADRVVVRPVVEKAN